MFYFKITIILVEFKAKEDSASWQQPPPSDNGKGGPACRLRVGGRPRPTDWLSLYLREFPNVSVSIFTCIK